MSTQQTTSGRWIKTFQQLHGQRRDAQWAARLIMKLKVAGVPDDRIDEVLAAAYQQSETEQASPVEIFGTADTAALEQIEELSLSGAPFEEPTVPHRAIAVGCLLFGAVLCCLLGVLDCTSARVEDWSLGSVLTIPVQVLAVWVGAETFATWMRRHSGWMALVLSLVAAAPVLLLQVAASHTDVPLGRHASAWWFAFAVVMALAAGAARQLIRASRPRMVQAGDNHVWTTLATAELRRRDDLTRAQANEVIAQAQDHAAHTGASLGEEFGNPRGYVQTLPTRPEVSLRRTAWWMTGIFVLDALLLIHGGIQVWKVLVLGCAAICAAGFWICAFRARTSHS